MKVVFRNTLISFVQMLSIWDWTVEAEAPLCTAELDASYGVQNYLLFNQEDTTQLVSNSESQVIFYSWVSHEVWELNYEVKFGLFKTNELIKFLNWFQEGGKIEYFAPPLTDEDFNKPVGRYSQSIFLSNSTRALTATSYGNLVVWDTNKPLTKGMNMNFAMWDTSGIGQIHVIFSKWSVKS